MAPQPPVAGVIRSRFIWSDSVGEFGQHWDFTYVATGGEPNQEDLDQFASDLSGEIIGQFIPLICSEDALVGVTTTPLDAADYPVGEWTGSHGGGGGTPSPGSGASIDVQFHVPLRYRGGHPLTHFPPGEAGALGTQRSWGSDLVTGMNAAVIAFRAFFAGYETGDLHIDDTVCISYTHLGVPRTPPLLLVPNAIVCRGQVGSMRRRLRTA